MVSSAPAPNGWNETSGPSTVQSSGWGQSRDAVQPHRGQSTIPESQHHISPCIPAPYGFLFTGMSSSFPSSMITNPARATLTLPIGLTALVGSSRPGTPAVVTVPETHSPSIQEHTSVPGTKSTLWDPSRPFPDFTQGSSSDFMMPPSDGNGMLPLAPPTWSRELSAPAAPSPPSSPPSPAVLTPLDSQGFTHTPTIWEHETGPGAMGARGDMFAPLSVPNSIEESSGGATMLPPEVYDFDQFFTPPTQSSSTNELEVFFEELNAIEKSGRR